MNAQARQFERNAVLVAAAVLVLSWAAFGQVTVGDNIQMNLGGDASVGWTGQYDGQDSSSLAFGFNGNLTGYYFNPKFLNWRINPYYNQSRFNSNFNSITAAKGVNASAGLFGGSKTPIEFNFQKAYDAQNQLNFPGTTGAYETRGSSTSFDVNAGVYYEDYPTLNISFGKSVSNYEVLGSNTTGEGDARLFSIASSYEWEGFNLAARFNNSRIGNTLPEASGFSGDKVNSYQRGLQFSANRRLLDWMHWGASYSRNHVDTDYVLSPTNANFSVVNTNLSMTPTAKLNVNLFTNYSSNLSAQILSGVITGAGAGPAQTTTVTQKQISSYLDYGANANYALTRELSVTTRVDHREQTYSTNNGSLGANVFSSGVSYSHGLLGGNLGMHYGFSWFDLSTGNSGATGHSGSVSYNRDVLGFHGGIGGQYSHNVATALVAYSQDGYSGNLSLGHGLWRGWNASVAGTYGKSTINGLNDGRSMIQSYNATLSAPRFSVSGNFSKNYGDSLPFGGGGPVPPIIPGLIFYRGNAWGVSTGIVPKRRLTITASYSHVLYHSDNISSITDSLSNRFEAKSEYRWRQMSFNGGFAHITQGIGAAFNNPDSINVVYFGVSRHFDVF